MWQNYLSNREGLDRIFKDQPFGNKISVQKLCFEGKDTIITVDLLQWPNDAPAKWTKFKYNTVQLKIVLGACTEVHLKDWGITNVGEFRISPIKGTDLLSFKFVSNMGAYFSCVCDVAFLSKVAAYQNA